MLNISGNKISLRIANVQDAPEIAEFTAQIALETEGIELDPDIVLKGVENGIRQTRYGFYILAEMDQQRIGCLMITYEWSDWRNGVQWWLQSVFVKPGFRGQGIFKMLFNFVLEQAREQPDVCGIRLYVEQANQAAIATYQSLGLNPTGYLVYEKPLMNEPA